MNAIGFDIGGSSVKAALIRDGAVAATARSFRYDRPEISELTRALSFCVGEFASSLRDQSVKHVGLCLPGVLSASKSHVQLCVNIPALEGIELAALVQSALPESSGPVVVGDAHAATVGYWRENRGQGRLLGLAIGTGVGACVLDDGIMCCVTGESSGHIGQIDVGPCDERGDRVCIGPDGGRDSLEAYLGVPALRSRYGPKFAEKLPRQDVSTPPMRALIRAIRVCHAIYSPRRIVLLGGIGIRLTDHAYAIKAAVDTDLTSVADSAWALEIGSSDFHAAIGAAFLGKS